MAVDEAGVFASSAVTLRDGSYRLDLLAPGNYTIYAEPLDSPTTPDQIAGTFFDPVLIETGFQPQFYRDSPVPSVSVAAALLTPSVDIEVRKSQATIDPEYLGALQFGDKGAPLSTSPAGVHQGTSAQIVLTGTGIETLPEQSSLNFLGPYLLSGPATSTIAAGSGYTFKYFPLTVSRDAPRGSYSFFFQAGAEASVVTGGVEVFSPFRFLQTFAHSVFLPGIASSELYLLNTSLQSNASARLIARNTLGSEVGVASSSAVPADASNISLAPAASSFIQTQGGEDFVGSLAAEADQPIGAALLLQTSFGTTGVSASRPLLSFIAPVELKSGGAAANTGVAIANQDIRPALVFLQLQNERGQFLARTILTLEGNSQRAAFVNELFTDYNFRAEPVFRGTLLATANRLVSATVIRTSPSVFTTLPVLENRVASKTFFAHFANAGSLSSELILVNPSSLVRARTVQIQARSGDGSPAAVVLNGTQYPDGALTTQIPPLGSVSFSSSDLPVNGSIQVTSDTPVGGVVLFRSPDFGTAGVGESIPTRQAVLPVDRDESQGVDTGIALVNTEARPVQLRLVVRDEAGQLTGHQANLTLEPYEQLAQFPNGQRLQLGLEARFRGSVWLEADGEVALTALRQSPGVLTTFPAIVPDRFLTTLSDPR